jgi:ribonuclease HII
MLCGIDEAGRGALAGPLVVAGVILHHKIDGLDDSKRLTEARREVLFEEILQKSDYEIVFTDNDTLDQLGLSIAVADSIERILEKLNPQIAIMDGNTNFGILGVQAVVKADSKVPEVSAASILAKVSRDRYMCGLDSRYDVYGFKNHKGYGTKNHIEAIRQNGRSDLHRCSFRIRELGE